MRKMRWLAMLLALVMVAAACGSDSDSSEESSDDSSSEESSEESTDSGDDEEATEDDGEEEPVVELQGTDLTFHMITHSDDGPFWSVVKRGADAAAEDLGVEVVWKAGNNDPGQMVTDIEGAIAEGSSGIASSLPSPDQLIGPLQDAVAAGIPVYTLNSGVNDYQTIGATTHIGQTETIAGEGAGQRFTAEGSTHVLCARQEQSNVGLEERCEGLDNGFDGDITDQFIAPDTDQTEQINAIKAVLEANPDIDAILGTGPVIAVSALTAATDLGREVTIGGFDVTPEIIDAIEGGEIAFTVDQQQYLQGYLPILLMYLEVTNQNTAGGGQPILTGPGFITPDNAAAVKALVAEGTR